MISNRKVVLIGTGFVGMSMAYAILNQGNSSGVNELVLIDIMKNKAIGEAMDLSDALPSSPSHMKIKVGEYEDCKDADIVVITAGLNQKKDQTRLELLEANAKIIKEITIQVVESGFNGIFIIATNPVDLMANVVKEVSGFDPKKVIGSGTALDTARLRYLIGEYLNISNKNIHGYIMGEHGDSSFVPWEHVYVGCKPIKDIMEDEQKNMEDLNKIYIEVRDSAYKIINLKNATYYGIGVGLTKIIKTILNNTNEILTVSSFLNGEYGEKNIYIGVPTVINRTGASKIIELDLNTKEKEQLSNSCKILKENMNKIKTLISTLYL